MAHEEIIRAIKDRKKTKLNRNNFVHAITPEQIEAFAHMSPRDRLRWLEEANAFINKAVGLKARAEWDERFKVFLR